MAHILCMTTGLTGIVHASIEVVRRLEARGHRVTYACPWEPGLRIIERQGIACVALQAVDFDPAPAPPGGLLGAWRSGGARRRAGAANVARAMHEFGEVLEQLAPDLVIADLELLEHIVTAVSRGVPIALLSQFVAFWKRPGTPPVHSSLTPEAGPLRIEWAWRALQVRRANERLRSTLRSGNADRRAVLREVAQQVGFPPRNFETTGWSWPGFRDVPILQMSAMEFEFPHTPRPGVHFVGPMVAAERREPELPPADQQRLDRALARALERGQSVLHASLSTQDPGDLHLVERLVEAVCGRDDWTLIAGLGGRIDPVAVTARAANVELFGSLPQFAVLARANLSINHAGTHTINECLHRRVPMLAYSGKRYDQNGAAARVAYHGLGLAPDPDEDASRPADIERHIAALLGDTSIRARVNAMQDAIERYRSEGRLEQAVDELLARAPQSHQSSVSRKRSSSS